MSPKCQHRQCFCLMLDEQLTELRIISRERLQNEKPKQNKTKSYNYETSLWTVCEMCKRFPVQLYLNYSWELIKTKTSAPFDRCYRVNLPFRVRKLRKNRYNHNSKSTWFGIVNCLSSFTLTIKVHKNFKTKQFQVLRSKNTKQNTSLLL